MGIDATRYMAVLKVHVLVFEPTSTRVEQDTLVATSAALEAPLCVALGGEGAGGFPEPPAEAPLPRKLVIEPTVLSFGSVRPTRFAP
jgi:hypothetical protein